MNRYNEDNHPGMMDLIDIVILTYNEGKHVGDCLSSLPAGVHVLVVDSGSTDNTIDVVESFREHLAVRVLLHEFDDFSTQRNWGLSQCRRPWVFMIDADEAFTPALWSELERHFPSAVNQVVVFPRRNYWGKAALPTGRDYQFRLFNRNIYHYEGAVHEALTPKPQHGQLIYMKQWIEHYTYDSTQDYLEKMLLYSRLAAQQDGPISLRDYIRPIVQFCWIGIVRGGLVKSRQSRAFTWLTTIYFYLILVQKRECRKAT